MAFDGTVMAALGNELTSALSGGVISKVAMPEKDELLLTIRNNGNNYRLLVSAGASLPLVYLTEENRNSPLTAPAFCMLLRKYIGSGKIVSIRQPGLERILILDIEHRNDLGDMCVKQLIFEMMGKYSNIIFATSDNVIIDSIKRVPASVSSIREVLPGRKYEFPQELMKRDILSENEEDFCRVISSSGEPLYKTLYLQYAGISPVLAHEICRRACTDPDIQGAGCSKTDIIKLYAAVNSITEMIRNQDFTPTVYMRKDKPVEFSAFELSLYDSDEYAKDSFESVSVLLEYYYGARDEVSRMRQKSADIRKVTANALERAVKKLDLQQKQLRECREKDKYKVYGDLLNTYGYSLKGSEKSFTCQNYYDGNNEITIPLDEHRSAKENAKRYFEKYSKLRRTEDALNGELLRTRKDIDHLQSILQSIEMSKNEGDLVQIQRELCDYGYIRHKAKNSRNQPKSQPLHFVSSDGYDIYAGKNNYQNEELSFKTASANDWWFHAKGVPGAHVIVKTGNEENIPDRVFEEAAAIAAGYSRNSSAEKVEVDYTQKKHLKRVTGGAPGFVIYHTNYSMSVSPKVKI